MFFLYYAEKNNSSLFLLSAKKCFFLEKDRRFNFFLIVFFPAILLMILSATHSHFIRMPRWSPLSCGGGLVAQSCLTLATPWTVACQAPLSMGFSRQEHWSGLPFPSPGDLPNPGIEPGWILFIKQVGFFRSSFYLPCPMVRKSAFKFPLARYQ